MMFHVGFGSLALYQTIHLNWPSDPNDQCLRLSLRCIETAGHLQDLTMKQEWGNKGKNFHGALKCHTVFIYIYIIYIHIQIYYIYILLFMKYYESELPYVDVVGIRFSHCPLSTSQINSKTDETSSNLKGNDQLVGQRWCSAVSPTQIMAFQSSETSKLSKESWQLSLAALTEDCTWTPSMQLIFFSAKVSPVLTIMQIILLGATLESTSNCLRMKDKSPILLPCQDPEQLSMSRDLHHCRYILFQHLHTRCSFVVACCRTPSWLHRKHLLPRTQPANGPICLCSECNKLMRKCNSARPSVLQEFSYTSICFCTNFDRMQEIKNITANCCK